MTCFTKCLWQELESFFFLNNELLRTENLGMQNALYPDDAR